MIEILAAGPLNTVQDQGRIGWRNIGVSGAGPMDRLAMTAANLLCGNSPSAACLEIQTFPFSSKFGRVTRCAIAGGAGVARLGSRQLLPWSTFVACPNEVLTIQRPVTGCRVYLAVAGGIDVARVLGSRSTDLRAGFGGLAGRPLRAGDVLRVSRGANDALAPPSGLEFAAVPPAAYAGCYRLADRGPASREIRVIAASEHELLSRDELSALYGAEWTVSRQSNRTGYRLAGRGIQLSCPPLPSHGIVPGTVQLPPDGMPIIQLADAKTVGGYPKIACVIEADLPLLGQSGPGDSVRFRRVEQREAIEAAGATQTYLERLERKLGAWAVHHREEDE